MKKTNVFLVLFILMLFLVPMLENAVGVDTAQDNVSIVLTDIFGFDMSKYKMDLVSSSVENSEIYGCLTREDFTYNLETSENKAQVVCTFVNGTLISCSIYPLDDLIFAQPLPSDVIDAARTVMQRYETYSGVSFSSDMYAVLDEVTEVKTMNVTSGNVVLKLRETEGATSLVWWQTIGGVEFPLGFSMNFVNGVFKGFSDKTQFYRVGNADVNVSKEEAISITKMLAKESAVLKVPNGDNSAYTEVMLNFTDENMVVELQTANRESVTLYPMWYVRLYAEPSYGGTDGFQAGIWADTGEIAYAQLTGHHGLVDESQTQSTGDATATTDWGTPVIISVTIAAILVTAALVVKKKRK
jgi:hypothetical protein